MVSPTELGADIPLDSYMRGEHAQWRPEYRSPFLSLPCIQEEGSLMGYKGSLFSVLDDLQYFLNASLHEQDALTLARNPALVTRALIERNIAAGGDILIEELIRESCVVMQAVYRDDSESPLLLESLTRRILVVDGGSFGASVVEQRGDVITWEATDPVRSEGSAALLASMFRGTPLLLIPLAHGGLMAGMDIFLQYESMTGSADGVYYPLRFSRHKKNDQEPQFSESELVYLQQAAEGRSIVIFEEDVQSGETHRKAKRVADQVLFPGKEVTMVTNCTVGKQVAVNYDL